MNEIKEIMNGNIKIFNMRIEGETIGFDTPYNSNWNFMPRDFEQIIDTLQQENARLKDKIDESIEYIRDCCDMDSKWVNLHYDYAQKEMSLNEVDGLLEILKEN